MRDEQGAIAFLKFYFSEFNRGMMAPETPPNLMAYADKGCISCKKSQKVIDEYVAGKWSVLTPGMEVVNPGLATPVTADKVIINFTLTEKAQTLYQNGKPTKETVPAASGKRGIALRWVNDQWQVLGLEEL
ncbi:hypothetical protein BCF74_12828 [Knoellia remsis]|uniref:Uncharacterized protein n=1 Tax=Knoellia remsis TaxID=407159 RepID=A0A2T0U670_9MICO|nr:hypothetical protein BCF74_12828 [Knoellia remsis]